VRLGVEVPHVLVAEVVRVRVAGQHVAGDVAGQAPLAAARARRLDDELQVGQVAGVVAVPRADQQGDEVSLLYLNSGDGPDRDGLAALGGAGGQALPGRAPAPFQRPGDAVAALGVRVGDLAGDADRAGEGAPPADRGLEGRRRVDADAAGLHVPR